MLLKAGVVALMTIGSMAGAQASHRAPPQVSSVPREAGQFDFLVGMWEITAKPKVSSLAARIHGAPQMVGTWKGWKVMDGRGIEDELRIVDGSGNPASLTHTLRVWSATDQRWQSAVADAYRGRVSTSSATWNGSVMIIQGRGQDPSGKAVMTRSRFSNITAQAFRFTQDRSEDEGKTWDEAVLVIDARRVAAAASR